jgi:hypothetical protein
MCQDGVTNTVISNHTTTQLRKAVHSKISTRLTLFRLCQYQHFQRRFIHSMFTAELKRMAYSAARETDDGGALLRPNVAS